LYNPDGVAVDSAGNLYIADMNNSRIRKVSNGVITTVAGTGTAGFSGDNGPVARAQLDSPDGVAVDAAGNLYIADMDNNVIRKVSNGVIYTVAGNGTAGFSGDNGPATSAQLYIPTGVAVDTAGNLYIADHQNDRIRKVSNGVITTVAGNGTLGYNGDDIPATSAALGWPYGAAVDASGDVFFSESSGLSRIRVLTPSAASCSASVAPLALSPAASGGGFSVTIQIGSSCAWVVQSLPAWITVSGSGVGAGSGSVTLSVAANTGATRPGPGNMHRP
jgi:sugar lactone lactonase YvrE